MGLRNTAAGWGLVARGLHWGMAGLVFAQLGIGVWGAEITRDLARRFELAQLHKSLGALVLVLVLLRLAWRRLDPPPPLPPMPAWELSAARWSHGGLLGLLVAMPLTGWVYAAASPAQDLLGIENRAFGLVLPDPWVPGNAAVAAVAGWLHTGLAAVLALLLAVHVAAALRHQFWRRDRLLSRMLRGR